MALWLILEVDGELCADALFAVDTDGGTDGIHQLAHQRQPNARATLPPVAVFHLIEGVENLVYLTGRDATARVADAKAEAVAHDACLHTHRAATVGEFHCIRQQVRQDFVHVVRCVLHHHLPLCRLIRQRHVLLLSQGAEALHNHLNLPHHILAHLFGLQLRGQLQLGQVEQLVHQFQQLAALLLYHVGSLSGRCGGLLILHLSAQADDDGQRGAKLVGHMAEELLTHRLQPLQHAVRPAALTHGIPQCCRSRHQQ